MKIEDSDKYRIGFKMTRKPSDVTAQLPDNIQKIAVDLGSNIKEAAVKLEKVGEKISPTAYRVDEYVFVPAAKHISDIIDETRSMYMDNNSGILEYFCQKEISPYNDIHIYRLKGVTGEIKKYDKDSVTDIAKQEFYENMKKLVENGKCNSSEILNEENWYMSQDGQKIYNISPDLGGYVAYNEREDLLKTLFGKLFN